MFYLFSAFAVILALKRLELSTAYAIWSGVGTALAAMIGITYFREPLTLFKVASLVLVILGVLGVSLAARQTNCPAPAIIFSSWTDLSARATA